jgi:hypothetical protein
VTTPTPLVAPFSTPAVVPFVCSKERLTDITRGFEELEGDHDPYDLDPETVHKAVLETAASARDVGSITWFAYVVREAVIHAKRYDLHTTMARVTQAYIDGLSQASSECDSR